jgi:hypothetical protein
MHGGVGKKASIPKHGTHEETISDSTAEDTERKPREQSTG